jgi:hypothetical protein
MADFSKQWCELYDPEMPHDFDIEDIVKKIEPGYYRSEICEGFGFTAIAKEESGDISLYIPNRGWQNYEKFINEHTRREL